MKLSIQCLRKSTLCKASMSISNEDFDDDVVLQKKDKFL